MFLLPLASYVASGANFECWLWALRSHIFFRLIVYLFFFAFYVACVLGFWAAFDFCSVSLFTIFAQYCLFKIPLLRLGENDAAPTDKICRCTSGEQRPRTSSCREFVRLVYALFRSNVPQVFFFSIQFASSWIFPPATDRFFVGFRNIDVSHVLLFRWLVPAHLAILLNV